VTSSNQRELISDFVSRRVWAVVGASHDRHKFGYSVFRSLRDAGYTVYPINPKGGELEGSQVYPSLADLPETPEVIDLVVPPAVSERMVEEAHRLGLSRIWMQPGAESETAITYCQEHDMQVVSNACATVYKRWWN
jgi:predicted CoA-binding protein